MYNLLISVTNFTLLLSSSKSYKYKFFNLKISKETYNNIYSSQIKGILDGIYKIVVNNSIKNYIKFILRTLTRFLELCGSSI